MAAIEQSKLFTPLRIANGDIELAHRVVLAPLTRNRGVPLRKEGSQLDGRLWVADELNANHYQQRATKGGLLISEGIHPNEEAGCTPGVPGLFVPEHADGWRKVTDAVHEKGAFIYAQLWHAGRCTLPVLLGGKQQVAPSAVQWPDDYVYYWGQQKFKDHPPREMTIDDIKRTIDDYVNAAKMAISAGFDGIEVHGANGYLPEQFLSSNINQRTDKYGGSPEKRCTFVLELLEAIINAIGVSKVALRLSPFSLFNQARSQQRLETWGHLCREVKSRWELSYVHFIEPRFEQFISYEEKDGFLKEWGLESVSLDIFREIFGCTPFFSAGGFNNTNSNGVVDSGKYDALVYGRYFISNPDFVRRLREGLPLTKYRRELFYGPFDNREEGYTDYPFWEEQEYKGENGTPV